MLEVAVDVGVRDQRLVGSPAPWPLPCGLGAATPGPRDIARVARPPEPTEVGKDRVQVVRSPNGRLGLVGPAEAAGPGTAAEVSGAAATAVAEALPLPLALPLALTLPLALPCP